MPTAEWSGCLEQGPGGSHFSCAGPAGHFGQRARAGVWDFRLFLTRFLPPCPSDAQCSAPVGSGWGNDMNVTGGDTFCLCFKESDVPFAFSPSHLHSLHPGPGQYHLLRGLLQQPPHWAPGFQPCPSPIHSPHCSQRGHFQNTQVFLASSPTPASCYP